VFFAQTSNKIAVCLHCVVLVFDLVMWCR